MVASLHTFKRYLIVLAIIIVGICKSAQGQTTDLFISEYVEGSSNNKYIEIYNGTGASANLADYQLILYANGSGTATTTNTLSGTLANGAVIVYKNSAATIYGGAATAITSIAFNGDDAIALYKISTSSYVDIVGNIGCDPGTAWVSASNSTLDKTLKRISSTCTGVLTDDSGCAASFSTEEVNWTQANVDDVTNLGSFTSTCSSSSLTVSTATLTGFTYVVGSGPSTSQTYNLSGSGLTGAPGNITVNGSTNYEVSTDNASFGASRTVAYTTSTLASTPIYVRLKAGLSVNTYNSEQVTNAGGGATTQTVTCSGSVTGSNLSDIITANGESATISSVINTAGPLTSAQGTQVWQFTVRDGGASSPDGDNLASIVTGLQFTQGTGNQVSDWAAAIQAIDLFDGVTNVGSGVVATGPNTVTFTGLNISVPDNSTKTISVRLTLKCGIGASNFDGEDFVFQLTGSNANITFSPTGSGKTAFTAFTTTNNLNAISIIATRLSFTQQPTTTGLNQSMAPSVTVSATDVCGNVDPDFGGSVSITSTGTLTGSPVSSTASAGLATFSTLTHTATGTNLTLTAASAGLTSATSSNFDINTVTVFGAGDIAIVGMCTYVDSCLGAGPYSGVDEMSFVSFEDIGPGTTIDITDNGFERDNTPNACGTNSWGNTEGVIRLTRTTSTIPKGTVITIRMFQQSVFVGVQPDANWTVTYPNSGFGNFDMNSQDEQIYVMQGGTWNPGTAASHDATYTGGTLMFGINTYTAWTCGNNSTSRGNLPDAMRCFSILPGIATRYIKYTGATTPANQKDWVDRLNSSSNWTGMNSCAAYTAAGLNYSGSSQVFSITAGGFNGGYWTGATNTDWFDCNNWQNFKVPDSLANVTIDNVTNDPVIGASPALYPGGAICNNMSITSTSGAGILTLNNAASYLSIKGSVTNNGTISGTLGNVEFRSAVAQTFGGSGSTTFYNMWLKNSNASSLTMSQDITISNQLKFTTGILNTGTNKVIITNTAVPTITGYGTTKFINGNLRQSIANNTSTYVLPLGLSSTSSGYHPADFMNGNITGVTYLDASVNTITNSGNNIDANIATSQSGIALTNIDETAEWNITPNAAATGGEYGVNLYVINSALSASDDDKFFVVKRDNTSTTYADWNTFDGTTFIPTLGSAGRIYNAGSGYATRVAFTSFSKFAIGTIPAGVVLPVELVGFTGKRNAQHIILNWETAVETNLSHFEIQKSGDALFYEVLGKPFASFDGRGGVYTITDENPVDGINYYKLFSVDNDGKQIYQKTISVNYKNDMMDNSVISYTDDKVIVSFKEINKQTEVGIYNLNGQLIKTWSYEELMNGALIINNSDFAKGMYILRVGQKFSSSSDKIIIR